MSDDLLPQSVELVINPRLRDLGDGFTVRRILPYARRRHVGPFVFLDHMGPVAFASGQGLDVRPHPHIGLATVTYLFEGEIMHRDSLGVVQSIRPGDVNWMVAGKGIAHSERTPDHLRPLGSPLHGVQAWVALPTDQEEVDPAFQHVSGSALSAMERDGSRLRLIAGAAFGMSSPVRSFAPMFYLDAKLDPGGVLPLPGEHEERAIYVVDGIIAIDGASHEGGSFIVFRSGARPRISANSAARLMMLGGAPLDAERHIWWNFVSSSPERIEQAKRDWREGRFAAVPGDDEFIPLPEL